MARAGVTVDAPMTASSVRVDGLLEGNIRRIVRGDDAARFIRLERRGDAFGFRLGVPPVVKRLEVRTLEPSDGVRKGAASLQSLRSQGVARHRMTVHTYSIPVKIPHLALPSRQRSAGANLALEVTVKGYARSCGSRSANTIDRARNGKRRRRRVGG